jgi:hypothetical protein
MSEYMFGVTRKRLSARDVKRRDRICVEEGGTGYQQICDPGSGWKGWFTGLNLGSPFDDDLRRRVMSRVRAAGDEE